MLVLSRNIGETIYIGENIAIKIIEFDRGKVRIGVTAPKDIPVYRNEIRDKLIAEGKRIPRLIVELVS